MRRSNLAHTQPNSRKTHLAFAAPPERRISLSLYYILLHSHSALLSICFVNLWQQFRPFAWKGEFSTLCAPANNFCSDWLRESSERSSLSLLQSVAAQKSKREEREIQTKGLRAVFGPGRAHIYQKRAVSFFAAIYETCQGCVEFIDCIFADSELCSAGLWRERAYNTAEQKIPSIVNIISLWKSHTFYIKRSPLVVLLNKKPREIVYPKVHPYKISRNKIWAGFLLANVVYAWR